MADSRQTVFVVGLGLMGASLGVGLGHTGRWCVTGWDRDPAKASAALAAAAIERVMDGFAAGVEQADLIVLATPILSIVAYIEELQRMAAHDAVIMDVGSTKRRICAAMEKLSPGWEAIGGHPMTGMLTAGTAGADADLYRGKRFVLTPTARTGARAADIAARVLDDLGALPVRMSPEAHDRAVALISHLPHYLGSPLLSATAELGQAEAWTLAAGGFRGAVGHAVDNPAMWIDIALTNGDFIADALRALGRHSAALAEAMAAGDETALRAMAEQARVLHDQRLD